MEAPAQDITSDPQAMRVLRIIVQRELEAEAARRSPSPNADEMIGPPAAVVACIMIVGIVLLFAYAVIADFYLGHDATSNGPNAVTCLT